MPRTYEIINFRNGGSKAKNNYYCHVFLSLFFFYKSCQKSKVKLCRGICSKNSINKHMEIDINIDRKDAVIYGMTPKGTLRRDTFQCA